MSKIVWRDIPKYESTYQISSNGKIRSKDRYIHTNITKNKKRLIRGLVRKPVLDQDGYKRICLYGNGKPKLRGIHRLVAETFIPNPLHKPQVNHIDGNKLNNSIENLEWVTQAENEAHAQQRCLKACGEQNGWSKLTANYVVDIRKKYVKGVNQYNPGTSLELRKKYKISNTHLIRIVNKTWWRNI